MPQQTHSDVVRQSTFRCSFAGGFVAYEKIDQTEKIGPFLLELCGTALIAVAKVFDYCLFLVNSSKESNRKVGACSPF